MKKIVLILLILSLFTACENEPLDPDLTEQGEGAADDDVDEDDSESGDLTLSVYELDTQLNANVFGMLQVKSPAMFQ
jgi:hypothetical protein